MKTHYIFGKVPEHIGIPKLDTTWAQCGKEIPLDNLTNELNKVTCKNCLKAFISNEHWIIRESSRAISESSKEIKEAQKQLDKLRAGELK